jgi:hypothetical protein
MINTAESTLTKFVGARIKGEKKTDVIYCAILIPRERCPREQSVECTQSCRVDMHSAERDGDAEEAENVSHELRKIRSGQLAAVTSFLSGDRPLGLHGHGATSQPISPSWSHGLMVMGTPLAHFLPLSSPSHGLMVMGTPLAHFLPLSSPAGARSKWPLSMLAGYHLALVRELPEKRHRLVEGHQQLRRPAAREDDAVEVTGADVVPVRGHC